MGCPRGGWDLAPVTFPAPPEIAQLQSSLVLPEASDHRGLAVLPWVETKETTLGVKRG
jgi:hypothetical protein